MSTKDTSARLGDIGPYTLGLDTCRSLECKGPKAKDMRTWRPRIHAHRETLDIRAQRIGTWKIEGLGYESLSAWDM
jgi:hypothetical protein